MTADKKTEPIIQRQIAFIQLTMKKGYEFTKQILLEQVLKGKLRLHA